MHPVAISAVILAACALLCRAFRYCAQRQRDVFLDHERAPFRRPVVLRRFAYQPLPTTIVGHEAAV